MRRCMGCMEEYNEAEAVCPYCGYDEASKPAEGYHMLPGSVLAGKYIIGRTLGYGGFGVTYIGYDAELNRKIAVKEYLPGEFATRVPGQTQLTIYEGERREQFEAGIDKFMDEAKRLARFQNAPGIVHIYDSFFENKTAYIVMEYIEGETLKQKIERDGKMSVEQTLHIVLPIIAAMKEVHAAGIIHRDIAPDNIMIDKEGNAKLIDFGAARYATTTYTKSLSVLIKPGYAPMEQYQSRGQQGTWTDVYALAATMYTMLTGCVPEDAMERFGKDTLKPLSKEGVKVSKNLETAIRNAMNIKVEERTPTMEVFEQELLSEGEVARLVVKKDKNDVGKWPVWVKAVVGSAAALILCFVMLLATGVISFSGGGFGGFVVALGKTIVPNMVNVTVEQAENAAQGKKLEIQIVGKVYSDEIPEGYVLDQNVKAGTKVEEGSVLELTISAGAEKVYMPSVEGLSKEDAIALLEAQGLKYTLEEVDSMIAPGNIVSQSVGADEEIAKQTEIVLTVSRGMENVEGSEEVEMPDLGGVDYAVAQEMLANIGLYIAKESEAYDSRIQKGGVLYQSVPAGNMLRKGETVSVQISKGKEQARVPDVWLDEESVARQKLADAGLIASVVYESSETVKKGLVISQSIEAKTFVDMGTSIQIVVSTGKAETGKIQNNTTASVSTPTNTPVGTGAGTPTAEPAATLTSAPASTATPKPVAQWSDWVENLPAGVTADGYEIEQKTQYSSRNKTIITTADAAPAGWTLESSNTEPGAWGDWSGWSTTAQTASDTKEVQTETRYQYRDKETTSSNTPLSGWELESSGITGWTGWSDWSDSGVAGSETRQVETRQVDDPNSPIMKTYYSYSRWYLNYEDPDAPGRMVYRKAANRSDLAAVYNYLDTYKGKYWSRTDGEESTGWRESPLTQIENSSTGAARWEGDWYNQTTEDRVVAYNQKTQYRYCDAIYTYNYWRWKEWSTPSTTPVSADTNREVSTVTYYRYRSRTMVTTNTYSKWSDWSGYSDTPVTASATTEVRTKTYYRYKQK